MNLRDALHVWRRRWILTLLLLLAALAACTVAYMKLPKHYSAQSYVVLLPSVNSTIPNGHNPYLTNNGSLPMTAQILAYQLTAPDTIQSLAIHGYTQGFTVVLAPNTAGAPILNVAVTGSDKNAVESTLYGVTDEIATKLSALQSGITSANRITASTLSVDAQPTLSRSKTARSLVIVGFLGFAFALAIPLIVDGITRRRNPDVNGAVSGRIRDRISLPTSRSPHTAADALPLKTPGNPRRQITDEADPTFGRNSPSSGSMRH